MLKFVITKILTNYFGSWKVSLKVYMLIMILYWSSTLYFLINSSLNNNLINNLRNNHDMLLINSDSPG